MSAVPTPRRSARKLAELIAEPRRALTDEAYWSEPVCHRWLDHVANQIHQRLALPVRTPEFRARLLWSQALLLVPNRRRRARAAKLLDRSRRIFLGLGMPAEAVAITAELARLDPEGPVPEHCAEVLPLLEPGHVQRLVERLERVHMTGRVDLAIELRGALTGAPALGV
jgi:hypothetical protein